MPSSNKGEESNGQMNSPAYQYYRELLKSGDVSFRVSTYACFDDDQQSKNFMVIYGSMVNKQKMMVTIQNYKSGVSEVVWHVRRATRIVLW